MPITPHFVISQTESHVQIDIKVPHVRVSPDSVQVVLTDDNKCLHFASPPYLLILTFRHAFQDNAEDSCAQYEPLKEHGTIVLKLAKEESGVYWDDLDLVGSLMKPRENFKNLAQGISPQKSKWLHEVLEESSEEQTGNDRNPEDLTETPVMGGTEHAELNGYGFSRMFCGVFTDLARDGLAREMLEVPFDADSRILRIDNPLSFASASNSETNADSERKRHEMEASKFSAERFLQDLDVQDEYLYQNAISMKPHWKQNQNKHANDCNSEDSSSVQLLSALKLENTPNHFDRVGTEHTSDFFTAEESAQLASIPYPLLPPSCHDKSHLYLGILDILFGYVYDYLLTDGEPTVESAWTISILSCSLSWLESFDNGEHVGDIMAQSIRRALIYPYLRNFGFAIYIWQQVSCILKSGRRSVIRSLLQIRKVLDQSELFYLGNKLFVDPYLAWLQTRSENMTLSMDENLMKFATEIDDALSDTESLRQNVGLDLSRIEMEYLQSLDLDDGDAVSSSSEESEESDSSDSEDEDSDSDDESTVNDEHDTPKSALSDKTTGMTTLSAAPVEQASSNTSADLLELGSQEKETNSLMVDLASLTLNNGNRESDTTTNRQLKSTSGPLIQEIE